MDKGARRESIADGKGNKKLQVKSGAPACGTLHGPGHFLQAADWELLWIGGASLGPPVAAPQMLPCH